MLSPVTIKSVEPCPSPRFSKASLITAERNGKEFTWEMIRKPDTVHVLVLNTTTDKLLYVKQVRVPVLANDPDSKGEVIECCAGLMDKKDKSIRQTVLEEIEEELGYNAKDYNLWFIKTIKSGVGSSGSDAHLWFATVTDEEKISEGGGVDVEDIEIVEVDPKLALDFILVVTTDAVTIALTHLALRAVQFAKTRS